MASIVELGAAVLIILATAYFVLFGNKKTQKKPVLIKDQYQEFPLIQKTVVSSNSAVYRFGLPNEDDVLGLPIGQHITLMAEINGKEIARSYTPTSSDDERGYVDILIKSYEQGNISKHVNELKIGDTMKIRGPKGFFTYTPNMVESFGMIAGGTGIAPMYQIIKSIIKNPNDKTRVQLIYGNQTEADILLKPELDEIVKNHPQIKVHYMLDKAPENWSGGEGYITLDVMEKFLPKATENTKLLICGPPPMVSSIKKAAHTGLGYEKAKPVSKLPDQIFVF